MQEALPPDWQPYEDVELQEIVARLSALTTEPPSDHIASELDAIRKHLRRLAVDNAEVGRFLGESLGLREPPDEPQH
jgi:DNA transposition AAA+ family ATPase